jgi:hypothetical protein
VGWGDEIPERLVRMSLVEVNLEGGGNEFQGQKMT